MSSPIDVVQLDALVVLKIIKHCKENLPEMVTGQLLGLDDGKRLEVTYSFPFPTGDDEGGVEYQYEMMKNLRDVNVDSNTVGWYQSTYLGSFLNDSMIEAQFHYQSTISKCVLIIYDPLRTTQGAVAMQAFRLTDAFMKLYADRQFTKESLAKASVTFNDIFEEIPIRVNNSILTNVLLLEIENDRSLASKNEMLDLSTHQFLEKNLEFLIECVDDLAVEQSKFQYYGRQLHRQQQQQQQWLTRRRQENATRRANGLPELPEDGSDAPVNKKIQEPSRLESLLITNQISNYCEQLNQFSGQAFTKMWLLQRFVADRDNDEQKQ